jgi:hypothetical protein
LLRYDSAYVDKHLIVIWWEKYNNNYFTFGITGFLDSNQHPVGQTECKILENGPVSVR